MSPHRRATPNGRRLWRKRRTPTASPPPYSGSSTLSYKIPAPFSDSGSLPASHHPLPIIISPVNWKMRPSQWCALEVSALSFSSTKLHRSRSAPLLHCAVWLCDPFRDRHGTSISHRGQHGWGRFTYSIITTVSRTCQCQKCTRMAVRVAACQLHPSTGQGLGPAFSGNTILYVLEFLLPTSPSPSCPWPPLTMPFWVW